MDFRLAFHPKQADKKIVHSDKLFLIGSCFTEQIGQKFSHHKFQTIENPNGILFNPISIVGAIARYIQSQPYTEAELFQQNDVWGSWDHHTRFSSIDANICLQKINDAQAAAHQFLKDANWIFITLGSAFLYELENNRAVANCHKVPTDKFTKRLLTATEIETALQQMFVDLKQFNPGSHVMFTISPVRHLRDGFVENNRSKANLISAVHALVDANPMVHYFPAYELIMDDLRDYRFFAEDMVHPNYQATQYVWEKLIASCISEEAQLMMKEIAMIQSAKTHKAFNPTSIQHLNFLQTNLERTINMQKRYPYINWDAEIQYFSSANS